MEEGAKTLSKSFNDNSPHPTLSWLMQQIQLVLDSHENPPSMHRFMFENTSKAAKFNSKLIKNYDYDFVKTCKKQRGSVVSPGTEFRNINIIKPLFSHHADWKELRNIISKGCDYKLENIVDEKTRKNDLNEMIKRGNHKSALKLKNRKVLEKAFKKEVEKGWTIPITLKTIKRIKNLFVIPLGVADQFSIDELGKRIQKQRVTHDASFPSPSGDSVNNRTIEALLQQCIYGQCLRRVIHSVHRLREAFPKTRIVMSKYDLDAAYRWLHVLPEQTIQYVTVIDKMGYIPLRLPFGVAAGPSIYSTVSETIFDLTNDILQDKSWNREAINSPIKSKLSKPMFLDDTIPFAKAEKLDVYIPLRTTFCDGYIDDFLSIGLDKDDNVQRSQEAPTLAVHTIFRPVHENEPIGRDDPISIRKLNGEGIPSEQKIMLGWVLCTRNSKIYLPKDKELAWTLDIKEILKNGSTITKQMESIIGRFNHVGYIMPTARYFLNRLRHLLTRCEKYGRQHLKQWEIDDFKLWEKILQHALNNGVSFNNITCTKHTNLILTDASEYGLGGYNPSSGRAWRFALPKWMHESMHINVLEFIACTIGIWSEIIFEQEKEKSKFIKIRALTDNSSAVGWLYKSSFNPKTHFLHDNVARKLATILMQTESCISSQHTPGKNNIIADSLSRDFHLEDKQLTFILKSLYPSQVNQNFKIYPLPIEITSWISSLKAIVTKLSGPPSRPERSKTGTFFAGVSSWSAVVSRINSLKDTAGTHESS